MTDFTTESLAAELNNDPAGMGYAAAGWPDNGDQACADLLNSTTSPGAATITRKLIDRHEIIYGIEYSECIAAGAAGILTQEERWYLSMVLRDQTVDANDPEVFAALLAMFPTTGDRATTRANIQASLQKTGSRAEVLWGEGTVITAAQVGAAANV